LKPAGLSRREFIKHAAALGGALGLGQLCSAAPAAPEPEPLKPVGEAKGIHPGRVTWVHDPKVTVWKGPGDGRWYEENRTRQDRVEAMMARAICELTGANRVDRAWDQLFRHLNQARGKGNVGYKRGESILIKPNFVGMMWRWDSTSLDTYTLTKRQNYMNTAPQMIIALLRQLVGLGIKQADISICDSLACLVHEYHEIFHREFPEVQYIDHPGKFGRVGAQPSSIPFYWSCRPKAKTDYVPTCFAKAEYLINFANLKAHRGAGVTLCGKNHFGSLIRGPVDKGYHDMHQHSLALKSKIYRDQVDLLGHAHLGGKTVLNLIDGLFSGIHPTDDVPRKWALPPFDGHWASSLLASQDPVAIDSVGFDFLRAEYADFPRQLGADDYLHEAAQAGHPPSGTFYDPDHPTSTRRLESLGVHEHWNNPKDRQYSRNLGNGKGIELVAIRM
jgi:hypothetical protein